MTNSTSWTPLGYNSTGYQQLGIPSGGTTTLYDNHQLYSAHLPYDGILYLKSGVAWTSSTENSTGWTPS